MKQNVITTLVFLLVVGLTFGTISAMAQAPERVGPNDAFKWTQPATSADGSRPLADLRQWEVYVQDQPGAGPTSLASVIYVVPAQSTLVTVNLLVAAPYGTLTPALSPGVHYLCVVARDTSWNRSKCSSPERVIQYDPTLTDRVAPSTPINSLSK
jgi:hypothetical protein